MGYGDCYRKREDLRKYVQGTTESLILGEILMGILILQYTFRMEPINIFEIITSVVSGLYLADLLSGLIHLCLDTGEFVKYFSGINGSIINHHIIPTQILQDNIIISLQQGTVSPVPLFFIFYNLTPLTSKSQILCQIITLYGLHVENHTHKLAHFHLSEEDKQKIGYQLMMFLQDNHFILHPKEHRLHHTGKHDVNFCIVNGWANPLLNSIVHIPFIHSRLFSDDAK